MDYDYRNRYSSAHRTEATTASLYPRIGTQPPPRAVPSSAGSPPYVPSQPNRPPPSSSGVGIKVVIKPEYVVTPPPQMAPKLAEVPRSTFHFNFEFEKRILALSEKDDFHNWSKIVAENQPSKVVPTSSSEGSISDPSMDKYLRLGLSREAVSAALLSYGDNQVKVHEFVKGYNLLREMGFTSKNASEALAMYDNNEDKALAYLLNH